MHHRTRGPLSAALRALADRCAERFAHRSRRLLFVAAIAVAVLAGTALLAPRPGADLTSVDTAAAARHQLASATAAPDATPAAPADTAAAPADTAAAAADAGERRGHHSDHRRQERRPATTPNPTCTLQVPADPISAAGLATPYRLTGTDRGAGACHEANADQSAFVEAAVYDPAGHSVSIYHPLVIDDGDRPAVTPAPVSLPTGAVVGVWFGYNGDTLTLAGPGAGSCVNGLPGSPFGQFAYCNAAAFFAAANADGVLQAAIPAVGTADDGRPCPTTRDFAVVDQDQSDNLATAYRVIDGRMAQLTPATASRGTALTNGSDEGLLAKSIAPALGCTPFTAPDLTNGGAPTPALVLNELSAAKGQAAPAALVPVSDPMVQVDGRTSVRKTNLYRAGVNMPPLPTGQSSREYCAALADVAPARLALDAKALRRAAAPAGSDQPDLLAFLQDRLTGTLEMLGCVPAPATDTAPGDPSTTPAVDGTPTAEPSAAQTPTTGRTTTEASTPTGAPATDGRTRERHHSPAPATSTAPADTPAATPSQESPSAASSSAGRSIPAQPTG